MAHRTLFLLISTFVFCAAPHAAELGATLPLPLFSRAALKFAHGDNAVAAPLGSDAVEMTFGTGAYPFVQYTFPEAQDWSKGCALALDVTNPHETTLAVHLRVSDHSSADGNRNSASGWTLLPPQKTTTVILPYLLPPPMRMGMREGPRLPETELVHPYGQGIDAKRVIGFRVFLDKATDPRGLFVRKARLIRGDGTQLFYRHIVDRYGQFAKDSWSGKVSKDEQLRTAPAPEAERAGDALDLYGGWRGAPSENASGFFRTVKRDGRWWLVTPAGHLFFSVGPNVVDTKSGATYVEGREWMFASLPAKTDPLARHYGSDDDRGHTPGGQERNFERGRTFNFYGANLERTFGANFTKPWQTRTLDRLRSWGFNTLGNWSDPAVFDATDSSDQRMPYVCTIYYGGDFARVGTSADWWGPMPDPFDPHFANQIETELAPQLIARRGDPFLIGYFVDNELSWAKGRNSTQAREHFSLLYGVLEQDADSPAKRAWTETLERQYTEIGALNQAWGTTFASWSEFLEKPFTTPETLPETMRADFRRFLRAYAERYFEIIATTIRRHDPDHLYLGARFSTFSEEQVQAAAAHCDVISFNLYAPDLASAGVDWSFLKQIDKPALVGEFHFGATDRGLFGSGLIPVANQIERARSYRQYVHTLADHPSFVGAHWFQYIDQPLTGRTYDGENYAIGLVTVTDTPYPELTRAAASTHRELYRRRTETK